ncbi:uncharacterized protein PRCAT00006067001 [Priceomyces carsonii]|uniref:uncharacterized protein n=1 Tax=Priceomyces carsonii TaxID=28549 RepID=UPI002EDB93EE|nr:unnamed protein product [Priceomyces carsonii]
MMASNLLVRSRIVQKPYQLFHYYFLLEKEPGNELGTLEFDTNINRTLKKLQNYKWNVKDIAHYGFLSSVIGFVFLIFPVTFLIKIPILLIFLSCLLIPLTSQFFVPALPVFTWLAFYFSCGKIPTTWRPVISVKVLPAIETIFYGDNLSAVLATTYTSFLDILAWIPYGLVHFSSPIILAFFIFIFAPPTSLRSFGFAFGYMNLVGVMVQILFPAAPPWYKIIHGLEPADYSMMGSPGGLGRIDALLGVDMYTSAFSNSPVVFGAFPSLHSGCAVMDVLFLCWLFPKYKVVWWAYCSWLWWSTMYLTHHYFVDLIGGAVLSYAVFNYTKYKHLPVIIPSNFCRWSYSEIKRINISEHDPLSVNFMSEEDIENRNLIPMSNYPYFFSQHAPTPNNNDIQTGTSARPRQASRSFVGTPSAGNSLDPNMQAVAKSSSSINLLFNEEPTILETETSSLENNSNVPSVFDEEHNSSAASTTSLDELESNYSTKPSNFQGDGSSNLRYNKNR